jgi:adenine-specific DNA-methyltransferase
MNSHMLFYHQTKLIRLEIFADDLEVILRYNRIIQFIGVLVMNQLSLFPSLMNEFPSTRYQGSKSKIINWLITQLYPLEFQTCLDAFGGTGVVAYALKKLGKSVTYNDILRFNSLIGKALIENNHQLFTDTTLQSLQHLRPSSSGLIAKNFEDVYFTNEENEWLDTMIQAMKDIANPYEQAIGFFALFQSCIVKRPYNLFHRKNLYIRLAEVERSFGNKASWDRPFNSWFDEFIQEVNRAVFNNGRTNLALNKDVLAIEGSYDLVYLDPPYISNKGVGLDYHDFYHFLEGMTMYDQWESYIDSDSKHKRLQPQKTIWTDKTRILSGFKQVFEKFSDSILVVSYRSDGIPTIQELIDTLKLFKRNIQVEVFPQYQYVLSKNKQSDETLLIGT